MNIPGDLLYTETHEWVKMLDGGRARVGITDHAQESMGDLVYIELPHVGDVFEVGDNMATVESVKATSDIYAPLGGVVNTINDQVMDTPGLVNEDCYDAWLVELKEVSEETLLLPGEYKKFLEEEG